MTFRMCFVLTGSSRASLNLRAPLFEPRTSNDKSNTENGAVLVPEMRATQLQPPVQQLQTQTGLVPAPSTPMPMSSSSFGAIGSKAVASSLPVFAVPPAPLAAAAGPAASHQPALQTSGPFAGGVTTILAPSPWNGFMDCALA